MQILYLDNIRGFADTAIPIRDVTFLLGENSTGKSTIMALCDIMNKLTRELQVDFNTDNYSFGSFNEIITSNSKNQTDFTIGTVKLVPPRLHLDSTIVGLFLTFESDSGGLPIVKKITCSENEKTISVQIKGSNIFSKSQNIQSSFHCDISTDFAKDIARLHKNQKELPKTNPKHLEYLPSPFDKLRGENGEQRILCDIASNIYIEETSIGSRYDGIDAVFRNSIFPVWIAPIRTKPKKTYDGTKVRPNPEGAHIPFLLRENLKSRDKTFSKTLFEIGKEGNLFDEIFIKNFAEENPSPFEVHAKFGDQTHSIAHVGYGVSQILPVIVESIVQSKETSLYIQQPEVHLHPRAQAALGNLFFHLAQEDKKKFLIETHSDFIIDRFRLQKKKSKTKEKSEKKPEISASVLFFSRTETGNRVDEIIINDDGSYPEDQPQAFRNFFIEENLKLLEV